MSMIKLVVFHEDGTVAGLGFFGVTFLGLLAETGDCRGAATGVPGGAAAAAFA